ncbi:MAG: ABC transporter permease [Dehalococcoidia bacterium]|nr:ABC transporter permease [Dehalococcoidia bacterium]
MGPLFGASLKMIVRDRQAVFWALAFPIMFLGVFRLFSFDSFGTTELLVVTQPEPSVAQQTLVDALQRVDFLEIRTESGLTEAAALEVLDEDRADAALLLTDFEVGEGLDARLLHGISDPIGSSATVAGISSVVDSVNIQLQGGDPPITFVADSIDSAGGTSFFEFLGPGIIGMGLMNFATISLAGSLSRYREEGVLRRIRATPLPAWRFFASVVGAYLVVAAVQVLVLTLVAEALGANVLRGGVWFLLLAVFGTMIFLNLGVIVAGRVRSRGAVEGAANAITLPMMFLSGAFFPVSQLPDAVRGAVQALPLTHLLRAMRSLVEGASIVEQWPELLILAAWVAGTFLLARISFSLRDS